MLHGYGRGLIQLTFQSSYRAYGISVGEDFTSDGACRDKLLYSPHCVTSAFWFYVKYDNKKINNYAQADDFNMVTACVNGGFNGYKDRIHYFNKAVEVLRAQHMNALMADGAFHFENSAIYNNRVYAYRWGGYHDPNRNEVVGTKKDKGEALKAYKRALSLYEKSGDAEKIVIIKNRIFELG